MAREPTKPGVYWKKPLIVQLFDTYQKSISFQKVTRGKTQLKYFGFRNVFGDFLFKRVAPEEG